MKQGKQPKRFKAKEAIQNLEVTRLNEPDSIAFFEAISKTIEFNGSLEQAMREHDERVVNK